MQRIIEINIGNLHRGHINDFVFMMLDLDHFKTVNDTPALSTMEIRARSRRLKAEKGVGLIIVDYLQLMRSSHRSDSREQELPGEPKV